MCDASEWFHDPAWAPRVGRRHWRRLPSRAAIAVDAALRELARTGARATFCVCGNMAVRHTELLRRVAAAGHELACAGHEPVALDAVPPTARAGVLQQWRQARAAIEAATGRRVRGFRAPWPANGEPWWREHLRAEGYAYEVLADGRVRTFADSVDGGAAASVRAHAFAAWELDPDQPRLRGLPMPLQRAHADCLVSAKQRLEALVRAGANSPIADLLALPPAAVTAPSPAVVAPSSAFAPLPPVPADHPRLAIVVPLKDEAEGVPSLLAELDVLVRELRSAAACEVVFVDDGSTDATAELLTAAAAERPWTLLVRHDRNRGVAAAIRTGTAATGAPWIASIDADLSYDPREIAAMLPLLASADVVTASPYHPRGGVANVPGWRLFLSRGLSRCYRILLRSDLHTWTACFRLYRREAVADLPQRYPGFLGTAELLVRVLRRGGRVVEHPCVLEARLFGVSKLRVLRTVRQHLGLLWQVALRRL